MTAHWTDHTYADIALIATRSDEPHRIFKARKARLLYPSQLALQVNLIASAAFYDDCFTNNDLAGAGEVVDGLVSLRIDATTEALAIVLCMMLNLETPERLTLDNFRESLALSQAWIAPVVVERLCTR